MWLVSAFLVGFLGSFHCAGMCGPIALALPVDKSSTLSFVAGRLLYNGGRILTYSLLGLLVGFLGHTIMMAGFQRSLAIATGSVILVSVFLPYFFRRTGLFSHALGRLTNWLKSSFRTLFGIRSYSTLFLIGSVNGLLPCGFVYIALAAASAAGGQMEGASYMALFGLGTLPMMLTMTVAGKFFGVKGQRFINKASPFIAASVAVLLIIRGFTTDPHACCHHH